MSTVLSAGIVAVILNLILPDNELIPKDAPPEPDADVEAQPVIHEPERGDAESVPDSDKKKASM